MSKRQMLKNKKLVVLLSIYSLSHIVFCVNSFYLNLFEPLFWLAFLLIYYRQNLRLPKRKNEIKMTLIIAIIFFMLYLASGFIFGFNQNSHYSLIDIFLNGWQAILSIWGIEIIRYKLLKSNNHFGFRALITIMIILSKINFKALWLSSNFIFFHNLMSLIIPIVAQNILFTYLAINAHYDVPLIIKIFNDLPKIILPLIPYRNWFMEGAFAIIKVLIIYYVFKYFLFKTKTVNHFSHLSRVLYPIIIISAILLVLFMLALFSYQPLAILSNSMNPTFKRGDVIIFKKDDNVAVGDIIVFQYQDQIIAHRVVGINEYYVTKGDANNSVDYIKVKKEDIKGVYMFHLKYLGYPSIWLNELLVKEN